MILCFCFRIRSVIPLCRLLAYSWHHLSSSHVRVFPPFPAASVAFSLLASLSGVLYNCVKNFINVGELCCGSLSAISSSVGLVIGICLFCRFCRCSVRPSNNGSFVLFVLLLVFIHNRFAFSASYFVFNLLGNSQFSLFP